LSAKLSATAARNASSGNFVAPIASKTPNITVFAAFSEPASTASRVAGTANPRTPDATAASPDLSLYNIDVFAVTLSDVLPEGFEVEKIEPQPSSQSVAGNELHWDLGTIGARSAKTISITGRATQVGCMVSNGRARICYEMPPSSRDARHLLQCRRHGLLAARRRGLRHDPA